MGCAPRWAWLLRWSWSMRALVPDAADAVLAALPAGTVLPLNAVPADLALRIGGIVRRRKCRET